MQHVFRRRPFLRVLAAAGLVLGQFPSVGEAFAQAAPNGTGCQLEQIAFCDTFDAPSPNGAGTRSGDLDGVVWGVSRATSDDNPTQGDSFNFSTSHLNQCGTTVAVGPPRDVQICNGRLVESVNDNGAVAVLAMYPRQPFDFDGRTGKVVFDVSNDTQGSHMAWPEFVITDQPVPAPFESAAGVANYARNSFGIQFSANCRNDALTPSGGDSWAVNTMFTTRNYQFTSQKFSMQGCVKRSPGPGGPLNHIEIDISPGHVDVLASDPGGTGLKQIASADIAMPLTRGLVWMEEAHYNADKDPGTQADHTFAWDNFGFDGPVLPRDLGFDVPDATHSGSKGGSVGYLVPPGRALNLDVPSVQGVENATAALLEFTWWPHKQASVTYSLNGNPAHTADWAYGNQEVTYKSNTLAVPVPLSELVNGTNKLTLTSTDSSGGGVSVANLDLILVAAGGNPNPAPAPAPTAAPAPTEVAPAELAPAETAPADDTSAPAEEP